MPLSWGCRGTLRRLYHASNIIQRYDRNFRFCRSKGRGSYLGLGGAGGPKINLGLGGDLTLPKYGDRQYRKDFSSGATGTMFYFDLICSGRSIEWTANCVCLPRNAEWAPIFAYPGQNSSRRERGEHIADRIWGCEIRYGFIQNKCKLNGQRIFLKIMGIWKNFLLNLKFFPFFCC